MEKRSIDTPDYDGDALEAWYKAYLASDLLLDGMHLFYEPLFDDVLDEDEYEHQIEDLATHIIVTEGFCSTCQCGLADWPCGSELQPTKLWQINALDLTAAGRAGCKLCSFFVSRLGPYHIARFRKIEARLLRFGVKGTSQLRLERGFELFLGHPSKTLDNVKFPAYLRLCCTSISPHSGKNEM